MPRRPVAVCRAALAARAPVVKVEGRSIADRPGARGRGVAPAATGVHVVVASTAPASTPPAPPMITTIVLIKVDPAAITRIAMRLAGIDGVAEVYSVSGEWDLVAIVRVDEFEAIARVVTEQFSEIPGIVRTQTLTAFRAYSRKDLEQAWDIGVD